jgi:hypothetical protein
MKITKYCMKNHKNRWINYLTELTWWQHWLSYTLIFQMLRCIIEFSSELYRPNSWLDILKFKHHSKWSDILRGWHDLPIENYNDDPIGWIYILCEKYCCDALFVERSVLAVFTTLISVSGLNSYGDWHSASLG